MAWKTSPLFLPTWDAGHGQGTGQKGQESSSGEGLALGSRGMSTSTSSAHPGMRRWGKAGKGSIPCFSLPGAQGSCCALSNTSGPTAERPSHTQPVPKLPRPL